MSRNGSLLKHKFRAILPFVFVLTSVVSVLSEESASNSTMEFEHITLDVMNDQKLVYRIEADKGTMDEDTRIFELVSPHVRIYDDDAGIKQEMVSTAGKAWPVTAKTTDEAGVERESTRYDWSLNGNVDFRSADGYIVKSSELVFDNERSTFTSTKGVEYRIPTGRGSVFEGQAEEFEAVIDEANGALKQWKLTGHVQLTTQKEEEEQP